MQPQSNFHHSGKAIQKSGSVKLNPVFTTRNPAVTTQQTKFEYVIQALDNNTAEWVQNIILELPKNPYDAIKAALIKAFGRTQAEKDQEL